MNKTFRDILDEIRAADEREPNEDGTPPPPLDLSSLIGELKGKVDGLKWVLDSLESEAEMLSEKWIIPLSKKKKSLLAERDRLKEYVRLQMTEHGWLELFGNAWKLKVQNAVPSVIMPREPSAHDFLARPEVVKQEILYTWKLSEIAKLLKADAEVFGGSLKPNKYIKAYATGAKDDQ